MMNSALDAKTRELIALAAAVTLRCDGCITTHVDAAKKQGATAGEITDARWMCSTRQKSRKSEAHRAAYIGVRSRHSM
jgi:AhpD family alkylhydroperoxidase